MFAGYRLVRVVSLAGDVRTYIALRDNPAAAGRGRVPSLATLAFASSVGLMDR
jgi:hypothetical protein